MSDFEDVFGAGADASMVIDGLSRQFMRDVGRGYQPPKPDPKRPTVIMGYLSFNQSVRILKNKNADVIVGA